MATEGSIEAPIRHPIAWKDKDFYDTTLLDQELRRVFDICHGCRRCFNVCDSFPRLFDMVDESETGEVESLASESFKEVVDACTLCDMCFLTKCPYVPPHEFNLDFPHLMLRYRAIEYTNNRIPLVQKELTKTDRNGTLGCSFSSLANWAMESTAVRAVGEMVAGIDKEAGLPPFAHRTFTRQVRNHVSERNTSAPAASRKAVIYTTCSVNYNTPNIAESALAVLEKNGVEVQFVYPECCGMPQLEHGDIASVAGKAARIAKRLGHWVDKGYDIISLIPSCTLMLKYEWQLIDPDNQDIIRLSRASFDISEYLVSIAKNEGLAEGLKALDGQVTLHIACHARAQNMGQKATEMLRLIPECEVHVIERCSGHGGSWGVMKDNFQVALQVGKPVARKASSLQSHYMVSECPLARDHIAQAMEKQQAQQIPTAFQHPVEVFAQAYKEYDYDSKKNDS